MPEHPTIADAARELEEEFALCEDWRDKVEYLIELGKDLPPLPEWLKTEGNKVRGCQSQVWLVAEPEAEGRIHLRAESDAILVKGEISLLLRLYDHRTPQESSTIRPPCWRGSGSRDSSRPAGPTGSTQWSPAFGRWPRRSPPHVPHEGLAAFGLLEAASTAAPARASATASRA